MAGFQKGDKVILEGKEGYIGGIHNYPTISALYEAFGVRFIGEFDKILPINKYFGRNLIGVIENIGKYNMFVIKVKDRRYVFCNDYNEMRKIEKKDIVMKGCSK